jgi:hypothetical protein
VREWQNAERGYGEGLLFLTTFHSMLLSTHARKIFRVRVNKIVRRTTGCRRE